MQQFKVWDRDLLTNVLWSLRSNLNITFQKNSVRVSCVKTIQYINQRSIINLKESSGIISPYTHKTNVQAESGTFAAAVEGTSYQLIGKRKPNSNGDPYGDLFHSFYV